VPTKVAKWHAVAHIVVLCAKVECQKPERDRQCDYLSKTMLNGLIRRLNAPGASPTKIENALARNIRRYVDREEQKAMKPAKTRA